MQTTHDFSKVRRGTPVRTPGGGVGVFVGVAPSGVVWVAYEKDLYKASCQAFDRYYKKIELHAPETHHEF